jgi:pyruvate,water dikinase
MKTLPYILPFQDCNLSSLPEVGGKNASLGELIGNLRPTGVLIPDGFAVTAAAFRQHLKENNLESEVYGALDATDILNPDALAPVAFAVREKIRSPPLPAAIEQGICEAYTTLSRLYGEKESDVAVRSSATAEDLPTASFAGQQETYLNVRGRVRLLQAVRDCMASLFTDRAIVYRAERGFGQRDVALSVGIQKMVRSDLAAAGVIFTLDTESGFRDVVMITGSFGLGEMVVQGRVNPDEFWVHKSTLAAGFRPIIRRELGSKETKLIYATAGTNLVKELRVPAEDRQRPILNDDELLTLARWSVAIEKHYSDRAGVLTPMDIEWAKDGVTGKLFIVQARPETVHAQAKGALSVYRLRGKGKVLFRGKAVGSQIGSGKVCVAHDVTELRKLQAGEILVAPMTDPDWEPVLQRAAAVVTDHGGRTCHAAILARELGIPCVVGTATATQVAIGVQEMTVCCAEGDEGIVYEGRIPFIREEVDPKRLPPTSVPLMLNISKPEQAFFLGQLPTAGVGLARIEFIISGWIGAHPMALLHPELIKSSPVRSQLLDLTRTSKSPAEYFVGKLATGVAQIAAAFYPRPVIVRLSDFKTNEYAGLLGGKDFEPFEDNPMLGWRGASRYYHPNYREGFALECAALRRARDDMGLRNIKVMVPFCRTVDEARKVLYEMAANGLRRGENGLEVYVMCEIPSNVILAEAFSELFDGFSIGSNDLTQLVLGIDRDSEILAPLWDEQNEAVEEMIRSVVRKAHTRGRKVGLCGQAPSDHPEFARFLAATGIDSISITSDALPKVAAVLARLPESVPASAHDSA